MHDMIGWSLLVALAGTLHVLGMIEALRDVADLREFALFILALFGPLVLTLAVIFPGVRVLREWIQGEPSNQVIREGALLLGGFLLYMVALGLGMQAGLAFYTLVGGTAQALLLLAGASLIRAVETRFEGTEKEEEESDGRESLRPGP